MRDLVFLNTTANLMLAALSDSESDHGEEVIMPRAAKKADTPVAEENGEDEGEEDEDEVTLVFAMHLLQVAEHEQLCC